MAKMAEGPSYAVPQSPFHYHKFGYEKLFSLLALCLPMIDKKPDQIEQARKPQ